MAVFSVWINNFDKRLPRLAFFTTRRIYIGEELMFDYQLSRDDDDSNDTPPRMKCLCESEKCKGYFD